MTADIKVLLFTDPDQTFDEVTTPTLVFRSDPERGDGWTLFYRDHSGKVRTWFVGGEPGQLEWARQLAGNWYQRTEVSPLPGPAPDATPATGMSTS